jgi:hypothetical protein
MTIELKKLWINVSEFDGHKEIRADFSNDRHHAVRISEPCRIDQVSDALITLAQNIALDPHLMPEKTR